MKKEIIIFCIALLIVGCNNSKKNLIKSGSSYWGKHETGNTTTLKNEYKFYLENKDTLYYCTNYYKNGQLKSKVVMKNDLLHEIELVLDTLGKPANFGAFENGNGYVIMFNGDGNPDRKGRYINGNKEGWWKKYHYTGYIIDSTLYKKGYEQSPPSTDTLGMLLDMFGDFKNNLYE
jgi:antitoxin component YwqK of YwqJK toxin-antitoxin module